MAVVLPELRAVFAAQIFVVHQLDAALPDEISLFQIFVLPEIFFGDFADEADEMRGHRVVRVVASLHRLDVELRERQRLRLHGRDLGHGQLFGHRNGARERNGFSFFETRFDVLRVREENFRQEGDQLVAVGGVAFDQRTHDHPV